MTKFTHLSDAEFLTHIQDVTPHSPIILELATRLEKATSGTFVRPGSNPRIECPVCMADLLVSYEEGNNLFDVSINKT